MDLALRCNTLSCRANLNDKAVVTTCSHIFCLGCGDSTGLSRSSEASRFCPACKAALPNPDDAVTTVLKPTEDYKTSVLSGLDPAVIMECASRGLAFWTYQASQEVFYQEWLGKNLTEKYSSLSSKMDKVIEEANSEMTALQNKINGMQLDQSSLVNKNRELFQMYTEKNKKQQQTQHLYDTLKKRILMSQVQTAASDTVNRTVNSFDSAARPETFDANGSHQHDDPAPVSRLRQSPKLATHVNGAGIVHSQGRRERDGRNSADILAMPPPGRPAANRPQTFQVPTPQHRTHLPGARVAAVRSQIPLSTSHTSHMNGVHHLDHPPGSVVRHPTSRPNGNRSSHSGSSGYGISAGIKMGRTPATASGYRDVGAEANRGSTSLPTPLRYPDQRDQAFTQGFY